mgnify:CR=1 FL=1
MYNITLIYTRHKESGNCNSIVLYNIIEQIKPEIIFEELSYTNFDQCYNQMSLVTLESRAIKRYIQNHQAKQIPVDTFPLPQYYYEELDRMYNKICNSNTIHESRVLQNLLKHQSRLEDQYGFQFLNSDVNDRLFEEINLLTEALLNILNDETLYRIRRLEKEIIERREYEILKNIYDFSIKNLFNQAIVFIGSGHRRSLMALIEQFEKEENLKLHWMMYNR